MVDVFQTFPETHATFQLGPTGRFRHLAWRTKPWSERGSLSAQLQVEAAEAGEDPWRPVIPLTPSPPVRAAAPVDLWIASTAEPAAVYELAGDCLSARRSRAGSSCWRRRTFLPDQSQAEVVFDRDKAAARSAST